MKTHPILFSASMVRALLEGRKTQTRRAIKPQPEYRFENDPLGEVAWKGMCIDTVGTITTGNDGLAQYNPFGQPGDLLWVRETFCIYPMAGNDGAAGPICRADSIISDESLKSIGRKWTPSIFMRREHSRLTLKITDVRIERLQDISEDDARAEGVNADEDPRWQPSYSDPDSGGDPSHRLSYEYLWNSINGNWNDNPWVWVVEFEVIHKNVDNM